MTSIGTNITEVQSKIIQVVLISLILTILEVIIICWKVLVFGKPRSKHLCWNWLILSKPKLWISSNQPKIAFKRFKVAKESCALLIKNFCPNLTKQSIFLGLKQTLKYTFFDLLRSRFLVSKRSIFHSLEVFMGSVKPFLGFSLLWTRVALFRNGQK